MITIRPVYAQHRITFSKPGSGTKGFSVMARDVDEIHKALEHYFSAPYHGYTHHEDCPLCRKDNGE